jgi:hypothetical protein
VGKPRTIIRGSSLPAKAPPDSERGIEPYFDDPFFDYDTEQVTAYANDPDFAA